ncbi:14474_t:CDS:2, partial [Entrophospora sp. SA101]
NYLPPEPKPNFHIFNRLENCIGKEPNEDDEKPIIIKSLTIRTIGSHPLWGHYLWNASKVLSNYLDSNSKNLVKDKFVLEFGAGGGLASLICAINEAKKKVVITDYPDDELIENIKYNAIANLGVKKTQGDKKSVELPDNVIISGYIWGRDTNPLLNYINSTNSINNKRKYDLILLSDLLANHSEHKSLLKSCKECLEPSNGQILVFFTHHRPHFIKQDLNFFKIATEEENFKVEKIFQEKMNPMFKNDYGDEEVRSIVYGYRLSLY